MRTVLQRVTRAEVRVEGEAVGRIGRGVVLLVRVKEGVLRTGTTSTCGTLLA